MAGEGSKGVGKAGRRRHPPTPDWAKMIREMKGDLVARRPWLRRA
jgi:ABC-type dipeptide/oligopeptide/nickel transport system permease subunit